MSNIKVKVIYQPSKGLYQIQDPVGGIELSSSVTIQNIAYFHTTKTSDYTIGNESIIFGDASSTNILFTLPDAGAYDGNVFQIKKIDTTGNLITISGSSGQTIDNAASLSIDSPYTTLSVISNGQNWFIL